VYSLDDENVVLFFKLTNSVGMKKTISSRNPASLKGDAKCSGHSACGGCDDIVESGCVWVDNIVIDSVVLSDFRVNPEHHGSFVSRHVCPANRPLHPLDSYT